MLGKNSFKNKLRLHRSNIRASYSTVGSSLSPRLRVPYHAAQAPRVPLRATMATYALPKTHQDVGEAHSKVRDEQDR